MGILSYVLIAIYLFALLSLFIYGTNCYILLILHRPNRKKAQRRAKELDEIFLKKVEREGLSTITVQLPFFNEKYVVKRLIEAATEIDYAKELLEIQILDDSTDETIDMVRGCTLKYQLQGFDIVVYHRADRKGYQAGALEAGLTKAKGEFIAIFDADFIPPRDFLYKPLPYFSDPQVGMVQARWGHINQDYWLLTRAQSMGIDGHFGVEQPARAWSGLLMNFNGTAGIWRKKAIEKAIEDAGGWEHDTLTEDMDLSYRAQLKDGNWNLLLHSFARPSFPSRSMRSRHNSIDGQRDPSKRPESSWEGFSARSFHYS